MSEKKNEEDKIETTTLSQQETTVEETIVEQSGNTLTKNEQLIDEQETSDLPIHLYRHYLFEQVMSVVRSRHRSGEVTDEIAWYVTWHLDDKGMLLPVAKDKKQTEKQTRWDPTLRGHVRPLKRVDDGLIDRLSNDWKIPISAEQREGLKSTQKVVVFGLIRLNAEEAMPLIFTFSRRAIALNACWNCGETMEGLLMKSCGSCSTAVYCSPLCQKSGWNAGHRDVCKIWTSASTTHRC